MPSSGAPEDTGQSEPNASGAPESSRLRIRYCLSARSSPSRGTVSTTINGSSCAHSGCMFGDHAQRGEPVQVGVVDQLRVRDHRPPVARAVAGDDVLDRVQRLAHRGVADGVDVDLEPELVDRLAASARSSHTCMPWSVQRAAVRRQQRAGLVLDDPVGEELHGVARSAAASRPPRPGDARRRTARAAMSKWRGSAYSARLNRMPQRVLAGRVEVGVDVGRLDPGVLHPGHAAGQVVVGGRAERADPHLSVACGHDRCSTRSTAPHSRSVPSTEPSSRRGISPSTGSGCRR